LTLALAVVVGSELEEEQGEQGISLEHLVREPLSGEAGVYGVRCFLPGVGVEYGVFLRGGVLRAGLTPSPTKV
jgi:hypothetical protein